MRIDIAVEGQASTGGRIPQTRIKFVSPGYFKTMGTRMIAGRDVTWNDIEAGGRVAIISQDFARQLAPEPEGAIGKHIRLAPFSQNPWREVIGVVQSVRENGLYDPPLNMVYWPVLTENMFSNAIVGTPTITFAIRSERAGTVSLMEEVREAVRQ